MQSEATKYHLASGVHLLFASWENEGTSVVFHVGAGETLLVTEEAAAVLEALKAKPMSARELLDGLVGDAEKDAAPEVPVESMFRLLTSLFQQGLVERAVS